MCIRHRFNLFVMTITMSFAACTDSKIYYPDIEKPVYDSLPALGTRYVYNNWELGLYQNGPWLFFDGSTPGFPRGQSSCPIDAGGFWFGALKDGIPVVLAADYYPEMAAGRIHGNSFGPISSLTAVPPDSSPTFVIDGRTNTTDWKAWPFYVGSPLDTLLGEPVQLSNYDSWSVMNDLKTDNPMGIQLERRTYSFAIAGDAVFLRFKLINRSDKFYPGAYFGIWTETPGASYTNSIGTDSSRNMFYAYCDTPGNRIQSAGVKLLYCSKTGGIDTKLDVSNYYRNGLDPVTDIQYYRLLKGRNKDGSFTLSADSVHDQYLYTGDPINRTGSLFSYSGNHGGNIASVGPFTLTPGDSCEIVYALIGKDGGTWQQNLTELLDYSDRIEIFFNQLVFPYLDLP